MSVQYPIWNIVNAPDYRSSKDYGARSHTSTYVRVGTSSKNSHAFVETSTSVYFQHDGDRVFTFSVDGRVVKRAILRKGSNELEPLNVED